MQRPIYKDGKFDHEAWTGLTPELYALWKIESADGTKEISAALLARIKAYAFARDLKAAQAPVPAAAEE